MGRAETWLMCAEGWREVSGGVCRHLHLIRSEAGVQSYLNSIPHHFPVSFMLIKPCVPAKAGLNVKPQGGALSNDSVRLMFSSLM